MEPNPVSEELPALYRAVLDRVAEIAASGRRPLANDIRREAIRIYSRAWDERARRDLEALLRRHTLASWRPDRRAVVFVGDPFAWPDSPTLHAATSGQRRLPGCPMRRSET